MSKQGVKCGSEVVNAPNDQERRNSHFISVVGSLTSSREQGANKKRNGAYVNGHRSAGAQRDGSAGMSRAQSLHPAMEQGHVVKVLVDELSCKLHRRS